MDAQYKSPEDSTTGAAGADTSTTAAGGTKRHKKHKSRDGKRQRRQSAEEGQKSPDSAMSNTEMSAKGRKRSKKRGEQRDDGGATDAQKSPEGVAASLDAEKEPPAELPPVLPPASSTDQMPVRLAPQQAPVLDQPPPTRVEPPAQKDGAGAPPVPATEERKPDDVFLVSAVACVVIIAGLVLALVGIILGMSVPAAGHGCPPLDKPLAEGKVMAVTKSGRLVGSEVTVDGVALWRFLGIPFAQTTAGDRRFTAPMPLAEPADKCAVREFLEPRPPCAQWVNGSVVGSEDCLRVNVWTSAVTLEDGAHGGGRALVVAVSGRWFETGSNDDPDWPKLAAKGHVVVVAPNHRQGVLGFLHLSSVVGVVDDVAVDDVVSAVQWALNHAEGFGADPKQLVLVGHGSGAYVLSAAARKLSRDVARRAFYQGIVYGSLLPFDSATPYLHLASAMNCSGADKSAWVSCFRAAPVDALLQAAQATSRRPLQFAPGFNLSSLRAAPVATPHTVVAGADAADDKALFKERILPLAQRDGNASTTEALVDYMFNVFNVPVLAKLVIKSRFSVHSVDEIAEGFSTWVSTCATLKAAKAAAEGYHYRLDTAVASGLLRPPLGIGQVAQFAAQGTVPPLADKSPWLPLGKMAVTRVVGEDGHENLTNYGPQCTV